LFKTIVKVGLLDTGKMKLAVSEKGQQRRIFGHERDKYREGRKTQHGTARTLQKTTLPKVLLFLYHLAICTDRVENSFSHSYPTVPQFWFSAGMPQYVI
jgi:hypothetical protein